MRENTIKLKILNKNKQHIGLKTSSVETRTAHSRDRRGQAVNITVKLENK